jgi:competence protein ComEC
VSTVRPLAVVFLVCAVVLAGCSGAPVSVEDDSTPTPESGTVSTNGTVAVHNINVGQSVSTLVVGPTGETILIDTGHYNDDGEYVIDYLQRQDIDRIDYLVTSHNDADHIGGNAAVIEHFETEADGVGAVYDPGIAASTATYGEYLDAIERHDVTLYEARAGDSIPFDGVETEVLGPPEPYVDGEDRNENSIVLRLSYGSTSFLYTGDAEGDAERRLVEEYGSGLDSTVYKAGHHGSSSSSSETLLDAVDPKAAVVSSAYDSQYGHPHDEVLEAFSERSIPTYWTATHGNVVFVTNGEGVSVRTQAEAPTDPLSIRDAAPVAPGTTTPVEERARIGAAPSATSTPTETARADGGTETEGELVVETIHADADGDDRENLNDEYVTFRNVGDGPLDLGGWTLRDEADKTYTVPQLTLSAGETVTVYTGSGTDTDTELYWGADGPVWNNAGDTVIVTNAAGERVLTESYS